jgi:hypothetical protein
MLTYMHLRIRHESPSSIGNLWPSIMHGCIHAYMNMYSCARTVTTLWETDHLWSNIHKNFPCTYMDTFTSACMYHFTSACMYHFTITWRDKPSSRTSKSNIAASTFKSLNSALTWEQKLHYWNVRQQTSTCMPFLQHACSNIWTMPRLSSMSTNAEEGTSTFETNMVTYTHTHTHAYYIYIDIKITLLGFVQSLQKGLSTYMNTFVHACMVFEYQPSYYDYYIHNSGECLDSMAEGIVRRS